MDHYVRQKLTEWGLRDWIETFQDQEVDEESFHCLGNTDIDNLITKVGPRAKFKKKFQLLKGGPGETADAAQVLANNNTSGREKRQVEPQGESSRTPTKKQRHDTSYSEKFMLSEVKTIMTCIHNKLQHQDKTELNEFLKEKICELETEKREMVGVFGKTGAGKSSLINAVIEEKDLLSSGSVSACTSVMIKVEANTKNLNYEAEIEFISKQEWKDDLWCLLTFILNDERHEDDTDDYNDAVEVLSALYGEDWEKNSSQESLCNDKHFREIPEFIQSRKKTLTCESAGELSAKLVKYTRSGSKDGKGTEVKRWFWPLVKCVTLRVPNNDFLQHVTLVDLPGSGDRNKSRDKMWKGVVESCSTVWIVADIDRAVSEKEPWEILRNASSLMGNGGQCQQIHFICTKSDVIEDSDNPSKDRVRASIFKRNMQAKEEVKREFRKLNKQHFSDECFKVFTVSSKEFRKKKSLGPNETEIPKLQEFLQNLNDCHSETLNYVSGAYGILSLMQGASCTDVAGMKVDVCRDLEENLKSGLEEVLKPMKMTLKAFKNCLKEGVENSKSSWERTLKNFLHPSRPKGSAVQKKLKYIVANNGSFRPKKGKQENFNEKLASKLTESIDEEFRKTFPNDSKCDPFKGAITSFSLDTEKLMEKYKDVELQLIYLRTEEDKLKTKLDRTIRERKKEVYSSLTNTIEEIMQRCYDEAKKCTGKGSLNGMREVIEQHVHSKKDYMFEEAKEAMLSKLQSLMEDILKTLNETMQESIDRSLKTDDQSLPDVREELETVKKYRKELKKSINEETSAVCAAQPGPSTAQV